MQVFVIYCKPQNNARSMHFNSRLIGFVMEQAALLPLPCLVMGDFNCRIEELDVWADLSSEGFQHLGMLFLKMYGKPYPVTCKSATLPDNAFFSPAIADLVTKLICLILLDAHAPAIQFSDLKCQKTDFSFIDSVFLNLGLNLVWNKKICQLLLTLTFVISLNQKLLVNGVLWLKMLWTLLCNLALAPPSFHKHTGRHMIKTP